MGALPNGVRPDMALMAKSRSHTRHGRGVSERTEAAGAGVVQALAGVLCCAASRGGDSKGEQLLGAPACERGENPAKRGRDGLRFNRGSNKVIFNNRNHSSCAGYWSQGLAFGREVEMSVVPTTRQKCYPAR